MRFLVDIAIALGVGVVLCIVGGLFGVTSLKMVGVIITTIAIFFGVVRGLNVFVFVPHEIRNYVAYKEQFEKIPDYYGRKTGELNDWLVEAQVQRRISGDWSIYPESILELEPIKTR